MKFTHYEQLPDAMKAVEVAFEFEQLFSEAAQPDVSSQLVVEALYELADRQWHTFEILRPDLRFSIERWFEQHWLPDPKFVNRAGAVAAMLGLTRVIPLLEKTARELGETDIAGGIRETLAEIKPHIDDPYWDLKTDS